MSPTKTPIEQVNFPGLAPENLPTMYDLPSESLEEPGLPESLYQQIASILVKGKSLPRTKAEGAENLVAKIGVRDRTVEGKISGNEATVVALV